jgi:hypothetical protein
MDPDTLRTEILRGIAEHETTAKGYAEDSALAEKIGVPLAELQGQLEILQSSGHVELVRTFGPTYGACLTPKGRLALERRPIEEPTNRLGF